MSPALPHPTLVCTRAALRQYRQPCPSLPREPTYDAEFQHFLRGKEIVLSAGSTPKIQGLTVEQAEAVVRLSCLPAFKDLIAKVQADEVSTWSPTPAALATLTPQSLASAPCTHWLSSPQQFGIWLESSSPEQTVPYLWNEDTPASEWYS